MILVIAAVACLLTVPLTGGRLAALAELQIRQVWAILTAIVLQVVIVTLLPGGSHALHSAVHLVTYALAVWFVWANRRVPGMVLIALGGGLNILAISVNGGVMPAWPWALRAAGLHQDAGYHNSTAVAHAKLQFLGDVIPLPGPHPIANVLSIGDLILFAGLLVLLHRTCRAPRGVSAPGIS
jgi:hypothetical protein